MDTPPLIPPPPLVINNERSLREKGLATYVGKRGYHLNCHNDTSKVVMGCYGKFAHPLHSLKYQKDRERTMGQCHVGVQATQEMTRPYQQSSRFQYYAALGNFETFSTKNSHFSLRTLCSSNLMHKVEEPRPYA